MGKLKKAIGVGFLVLLVWGGYVTYALATLKPQFSARWGAVNEKETNVIIDVNFGKPLMIPGTFSDIRITLNGIEIGKATQVNYSMTTPKIGIKITFDNQKIVRAFVNYMNSGQFGTVSVYVGGKFLWLVPFGETLSYNISQDLLAYSNITYPSKKVGPFYSPAVKGIASEWKGISGNYGIITSHVRVYNPNDFPLPVGNLEYVAYFNGYPLVSGNTTETVIIPPKGTAIITVKNILNLSLIPKVWELHINNNETTKIHAIIYVVINLRGQSYRVKITDVTKTIKTDLLASINRGVTR